MTGDDATPDATVIGSAPQVLTHPDGSATVLQGAAGKDPAATLLSPGTLINNNYRITGLVSSGGMGEVYRAENVFTDDPVAVKVILPDLARDQSVLDLFRREARVLVQLRHEVIVRYHNFVLDGGLQRYCLIMEFVAGRHLGTRLNDDGPLPDDAAIGLMRRLAQGLGRAHAHGVTHRDLSPDNVILRDDRIDEPVLIDFGIARSTEMGDALEGRFAGKFKYIAPEQLGHWQGGIGPWTDVYGLALLIAATVRGTALPMGNSVVSASAARQTLPDLGGISHRLYPLLQHMLQPDPAQRPQDMAAVLRLIDDPMALPAAYRLPLWEQDAATPDMPDAKAASHSPFAAAIPTAAPPPSRPDTRARRWPMIVAGLAALAVAAGAGLWLNRAPTPIPVVPEDVPASMAARDPTTREGFLADQPLPPCTLIQRIAHGPDAGRLLAMSDGQVDTTAVLSAYEAQFGTAPSVVARPIGADQCPTLDFARQIAGRSAQPILLQAQVTRDAAGFQITGRAQAGQGPDRSLWLFLVDPDGRIYDLTSQISAGTQGRFAVAVQLPPAQDAGLQGMYLLVGLGSDQALASVMAAPAGAPSADLLPRVLDELAAAAASPAIDLIALDPTSD